MHDDLLAQARSLAKSDLRRPKQANLRRAISATYYAVFHFLVDQSCRTIIGTQQDKSAFRHVLGRAFVHSDMKAACESFSGGTLKKGASKGLPSGFGIPKEIRPLQTHLSNYSRNVTPPITILLNDLIVPTSCTRE